jgi:uncharacterized protein
MTFNDVAAVIGGLAAGLLSGAIGIGGGLVFVPMLTIGFRVAQTVAQGTSLAAIVPTALVGGITHVRQGNANVAAALWLGGAGVVGAVGGALLAVHLESAVLARVFGAFYIGAALLLLQRAWTTRDSEPPAPSS